MLQFMRHWFKVKCSPLEGGLNLAKKTKAQLLKEAKARQRSRERSLEKVKEMQSNIPRKLPGVPTWATRAARSPTLAEVSQLAFTNRLLEDALIASLQQSQPTVGSVVADVAQDKSRIVNQDAVDLVRDLVQVDWGTGGDRPKPKRKRSEKQMMNDSILSNAFKAVNKKARKRDGSFKKGWDQSRVAKIAWKECTKERKRLGLCD